VFENKKNVPSERGLFKKHVIQSKKTCLSEKCSTKKVRAKNDLGLGQNVALIIASLYIYFYKLLSVLSYPSGNDAG
jgi:hypothetical protein